MNSQLQDRLSLPYGKLEDLNLHAKEQRKNRVPVEKIQEERLKYLTDEKRSEGRNASCSATSKAACTCSITTRSSW